MKVLSREETKAIFKPENIIGRLINAGAGWNRFSAAVINMGKPYIANTAEFLQLDPDVYDPVGDNLLIVSNTNLVYGAFAMTQDTVLTSVSKRIGGDFIILPGSVNEMYAVKLYPNMNMDDIQTWTNEVSHMVKDDTEFITTDIYIYRSKSHIIESVPGGQEWQL